jgi:predicted GNAT superfamily acetyltransferase
VWYYHSVVIRPLRDSDLTAISAINSLNVPAVGDETEGTLRAIMSISEVALGVMEGNALVGFAFVLPPGTTYDSPNYRYFCERFVDFGYLDRVAFLPSHQGRGLGAALYREIERRVSRPMITLEVNVVPPNEGSMRFHLREGFREVEQLETRPGKVVSLMVKHLSTVDRDIVTS